MPGPPCRACPGAVSERQFSGFARWVNLRPFPTPSDPNWRQSGSFPLWLWVNQLPFPAPSARNWRQSGNFPLCPVGESAPFSYPIQPGTGIRAAVFRSARCVNLRHSPPHQHGTGIKAAVFRSARCVNWRSSPRPRQLGTGGRAAVFRSVQCVNQRPVPASSAPELASRAVVSSPAAWAVTRTACHTLSGTLSCEILPFFPALSLSCVKNARCILSKNSPVRPVLLHQL